MCSSYDCFRGDNLHIETNSFATCKAIPGAPSSFLSVSERNKAWRNGGICCVLKCQKTGAGCAV